MHLVTSDICVIYLLTLVAYNLALIIITWCQKRVHKKNVTCPSPLLHHTPQVQSVRQAVVSQVEERKETNNAHLKSVHSFPQWE